MATYFADTSFWVALSRKRDEHHQIAGTWNQFVIRHEISIVTTEAVLWEWLNAMSGAATRVIAVEGYRRVHADPRIAVVSFQCTPVQSAIELYRTMHDKSWSMTDCLSFVVMERRHLTEALTTDSHFQQAGLTALMLEKPPSRI